MDVLEYNSLKAALEGKGSCTKWPDLIKGKDHQKFRKALLKRVKSGRYKLKIIGCIIRLNLGASESPQHANGK
jgi:hypothetical protein